MHSRTSLPLARRDLDPTPSNQRVHTMSDGASLALISFLRTLSAPAGVQAAALVAVMFISCCFKADVAFRPPYLSRVMKHLFLPRWRHVSARHRLLPDGYIALG